jgi:ABC-type glutathione transport system ATPase component
MLEIRNLHATVEGREILNGIDLVIRPGEVHAIMGPNGSGKSTLANVIAGREGYTVTEGEIRFDGKNLLEMAPETRACEGCSWLSSIRWKSRRRQPVFPESCRQRGAQIPRRAAGGCDGLLGAGARAHGAGQDGRIHAQALGQRRFLRWREKA